MRVKVIPLPKTVLEVTEQFLLTRNTNAYVSNRFSHFSEDALFALRKIFTSFSGKTVITEENTVILGGINYIFNEYLGDEAYTITINENAITLAASTDTGFLYANTTLKQLLAHPPTKSETLLINGIMIKDTPQYPFRGFMFDESRHFFGKNEVKRILDVMALNKLNKFIWHLSDDQGYRIESRYYPELNKVGSIRHDTQIGGWRKKRYSGAEHSGYYTREDIREVVEYASERNIEVIPELDLPSHAGALIASIPTLSCNKARIPVATNFDTRTLICVSDEEVINTVNNIIDEICSLFPSKYIHLGGDYYNSVAPLLCDECKAYAKKNGLEGINELFADFFNKVNAHIASTHGKRVIIRDSSFAKNLNEDIIVQIFSMSSIHELLPDIIKGRQVIITPANAWHFDYPYAITPLNETYNAKPLLNEFAALPEYIQHNIMGGMGALWTEWIYDREKIEFNCNPRLAALAERTWNDEGNYKEFVNTFYEQSKAYDDERINYAKPNMLVPNALRRMRDSWLWLRSDQYTEVRRNRKQ